MAVWVMATLHEQYTGPADGRPGECAPSAEFDRTALLLSLRVNLLLICVDLRVLIVPVLVCRGTHKQASFRVMHLTPIARKKRTDGRCYYAQNDDMPS